MRQESPRDLNSAAALTREARLKGQPSLRSFITHCEESVQDAPANRQTLTDEWLAANLRYEELAETEAGLPDTIKSRPLEAELEPLAEALRRDAYFRQSYDCAPPRIGWVELDKLIVSQKRIDLGQTDRLRERLKGVKDNAGLFRFALPLDRKEAPVEFYKHGPNRFVFSSRSADFRFHRASILRADQLSGYDAFGNVAAALGLIVGFGSNFLSVIESDRRMVLHDGHHRAYALRAAGYAYAPCIIQPVSHREELSLVATDAVVEAPALYFRSPRPPLLKDFFDPELCKELLIRKLNHVIEIEYKIREFETPDSEIVG